jgi:hypothetical protein
MKVRLREGMRFVPHGAQGFEDFDLWERLVRKQAIVDVPTGIYELYKDRLEEVVKSGSETSKPKDKAAEPLETGAA